MKPETTEARRIANRLSEVQKRNLDIIAGRSWEPNKCSADSLVRRGLVTLIGVSYYMTEKGDAVRATWLTQVNS